MDSHERFKSRVKLYRIQYEIANLINQGPLLTTATSIGEDILAVGGMILLKIVVNLRNQLFG